MSLIVMKVSIYLLTCNICRKQYVGQTVYSFCSRWSNYKSNDRKYLASEICIEEYIFEHFNSEGHTGFLENVSVKFIDKTDSQISEKRENYEIHILKTMIPWSLNNRNSV